MWSHKNMVVFASIRGGPVEAHLEREDGTKEMVAFDAPSITNAEERWSQMSERPEQLARWLQQSPEEWMKMLQLLEVAHAMKLFEAWRHQEFVSSDFKLVRAWVHDLPEPSKGHGKGKNKHTQPQKGKGNRKGVTVMKGKGKLWCEHCQSACHPLCMCHCHDVALEHRYWGQV